MIRCKHTFEIQFKACRACDGQRKACRCYEPIEWKMEAGRRKDRQADHDTDQANKNRQAGTKQ